MLDWLWKKAPDQEAMNVTELLMPHIAKELNGGEVTFDKKDSTRLHFKTAMLDVEIKARTERNNGQVLGIKMTRITPRAEVQHLYSGRSMRAAIREEELPIRNGELSEPSMLALLARTAMRRTDSLDELQFKITLGSARFMPTAASAIIKAVGFIERELPQQHPLAPTVEKVAAVDSDEPEPKKKLAPLTIEDVPDELTRIEEELKRMPRGRTAREMNADDNRTTT